MKILITGGAGYVGSVLIPQLLSEGHYVRVLDNLVYNQTSILPYFISKNFEFIQGDIRNIDTVEKSVKDIDLIIHLAAIVGAPACRKDRQMAKEINYGGTVNVVESRNSSQKLIYASTGSVYGAIDGICDENSSLNPLTTYGKTKLKAEEYVLDSGNSMAFRFATGYGLSPRLRLDLLPNDFVFQVLRNKSLLIYEKHVRRTFIHVYDIARSYVFGINKYDSLVNDVYNVGSEKLNFTKEDIALAIKKKIDFFLYFADIDSDPDKRDYEVSYEKIRKKGFETTVSLDEGLDELIKGLKIIKVQNPFSNI